MRNLIVVTILIFSGLVLGRIVWQASEEHYFDRWMRLPTPTFQVADLITAPSGSIYVKATDGETYRCLIGRDECWGREPLPKQFSWDVNVVTPCNYTSPEFSFITNSPRNVDDCMQVETRYADGYELSIHRYGREWSQAQPSPLTYESDSLDLGAKLAKCDIRVSAWGTPATQLKIRYTFIAVAVSTIWPWVLIKPMYLENLTSKARTPCEMVPSIPERLA